MKQNNMDLSTNPFAAILARHLAGSGFAATPALLSLVIPAMAEAFQEGQEDASDKAVNIYSSYLHSSEVITGEDGKKYMEVRLRWEVPGQESPVSRVYSIADEKTE